MKTWTADQLKQLFDERMGDLQHRLDGFPQEYAARADVDALQHSLGDIRADHVHRREIVDIKKQLDDSAGRSTGFLAAGALIAIIISVAFTVMLKSQLTSGDVSSQIQREAPWIVDRPQIEARLSALEARDEQLAQQLRQIQELDRFFCQTRKTKLPGC